MLLIIGCFDSGNIQAQDRQSRYEKIQKRKNRANRKLKRRGDRAKKARKSYKKVRRKSRQGDNAYKGDIAGRKVRSRLSPSRRSKAVHPQPNPYAGRKRKSEASRAKAFNRAVRYSKKPRERAWKGNISGNKLRNKGKSSKKRRLTPQSSPYVKNKRKGDKAWKGNISGGNLRFKGFRSKRKNVSSKKPSYQSTRRAGERDGARFSGHGFKGNRSASRRSESDGARFSGQGFKGIRSISGRSRGSMKSKRITPRSASGAFTVRKKKKPYAIREKSKWESAFKGDIAGRKFQTKRTTERPSIQKQRKVKFSFQGKGRKGDQAYSGQITGGYKSKRPPREKAWKKDISGHKLRVRNSSRPKFNSPQFKPYYQKKRRQGDQAYKGKIKGRNFKTTGRPSERAGKGPIPVKSPGSGAEKAINFSGNIKARKPLKGAGGSISGKRWNNSGSPIQGRGFKDQDQKVAKFQGNLKYRRKGEATDQDKKTAGHTGKIRRWKYQTGPLDEMKFTGRFKKNYKPTKNPNSVKQSLKAKQPKGNYGINYTGNIKQWKYKTGPLDDMKYEGRFKRNYKPTKNPNAVKQSLKAKQPKGSYGANYTGNIKQWKYKTGPLDDMKYEGRLKRAGKYKRNPNSHKEALLLKAPEKSSSKGQRFQGRLKSTANYKRNPNSDKEALKVRPPEKSSSKGLRFQGRFKSNANYKRNPNSSKEALLAKAPKTGKKEVNFQGRFKQSSNYKHNPNSSKEALKGRAPLSATSKAMRFQGRFKQSKDYKANPNAAKGTLKGIGPSKAAISASNFQGNLKFKKGRMGQKHPSFKFEKPKNTVADKTKFSLKMLWSKLFKKSENQPAHLKEKVRKPRYDKGEQDLWND